ncbi:MAG: hypothetical protein J3Q66DRAFT_386886 [Benniella sp.]|nr:MAG: hypothetical protein J3Q66DRAFT_386886 [Benniella sp.]
MKASLIFAALAAASTASAYQCPSNSAVNEACRSINVSPLICNNPQVNVEACNARQCNQPYIDNYSACQCRRSSTMFYEHSANVEGLLRRCGLAGLTNPFGNPNQYKPGQGTRVFAPTSSATWAPPPTYNAAPIVEPTPVPVPIHNTDHHISGGSIAGIVLGLLAATALAGLLGWCWRKKRHEHMSPYHTYAAYPDARGPTRTVVTEKVEPVVVRAGHLPGVATTSGSNSYGTGSSTHLPHTTTTTAPTHLNGVTTHPTTATMGNTAYNTQPHTGADVVPHTVHNANNVSTNTTTTH